MSASIESGFIQSLPNITNKYTPPVSTISTASISTAQANAAINAYLTNINANGTQAQYPRTLAGFNQAVSNNAGGSTNPTLNPIFTSTFNNFFGASLGNVVGPNALNATDSNFLATTVGVSNENAYVQRVLDNFFNNLSATNLGGNSANYYANFQTYLASYLTKTTDIFTATAGFPSYQSLFNAFVGGTTQDFQNSFVDFYNTMIRKYNYFLPSQMLPQWINQLNAKVNPTATIDLGTGSQQTQIIFQLLALVAEMINTLQSVSTAQVQRLTFYANWQQAYTQLISKIPVVTFSDLKGKVKAPNDDQIVTATQQIGNINQTYTQQAQGYRDSVTDESKSQQSAVDQSQQALQAQSSLATTLLQNLSTILQSLFQG